MSIAIAGADHKVKIQTAASCCHAFMPLFLAGELSAVQVA
jgi:hypothetical protein